MVKRHSRRGTRCILRTGQIGLMSLKWWNPCWETEKRKWTSLIKITQCNKMKYALWLLCLHFLEMVFRSSSVLRARLLTIWTWQWPSRGEVYRSWWKSETLFLEPNPSPGDSSQDWLTIFMEKKVVERVSGNSWQGNLFLGKEVVQKCYISCWKQSSHNVFKCIFKVNFWEGNVLLMKDILYQDRMQTRLGTE